MSWFRKKEPPPPPPSPAQSFVQRRFGGAIAFASGEWKGFDAYFLHVDPEWHDKFTLGQRLTAFMAGPIGTTLEERFPEIAAAGAEADAKMNVDGHKFVIIRLIVDEAIITSGTNSREEVEAIPRA